jgi:hypothetical protein
MVILASKENARRWSFQRRAFLRFRKRYVTESSPAPVGVPQQHMRARDGVFIGQ